MKSFSVLNLTICSALALAFLAISGCGGGDIGAVSGVITIDGKPIENATVMFYPSEGRASVGKTDANGNYSLAYVRGQKGALIGTHRVTVSTEVFAEENRNVEYGEKAARPSAGRRETLPDKYRDRNATELSAEVKSGSNEINFDLIMD